MLRSGEDVVLAVIVERSGSAPRSIGSRMVVRSDGSSLGTVGGGMLEAQVLDLAAEVFLTRRTLTRGFTLTDEEASRMGMSCGGHVNVLIHLLDASEPNQLLLYQEIAVMLKENRPVWLITRLLEAPEATGGLHQAILGTDGSFTGSLDLAVTQAIAAQLQGRQPQVIHHHSGRFLVEPLGTEGRVLIFGAGHIAQELALLTRRVGFRTIVLDDREEYANPERFPASDEIRVLDQFANAMDGLVIDRDCYLVLVTRGHAHDKTVLEQALRTEAGYIGMIGSKRKREAIFQTLILEGFAPGDFDRVRSPIGLAIGAETPAEIAVSIVAELIQVRAGRTR